MPESVRRIASRTDLVAALGPAREGSRAVLLVGGAGGVERPRHATLRPLFATLARFCDRTGTAVVDGGTDSGVMRLIAEARAAIDGQFALIGVAPEGAIGRSSRDGEIIEPARGHTLVLLVPGSQFGDETPWLFEGADHLARGSAPTILINGGRLARDEVRQRLAAGHAVIVVEGTGRAADELAGDEALRGSGRLVVVPLSVDEAGLAAAIESGADDGRRGTEG